MTLTKPPERAALVNRMARTIAMHRMHVQGLVVDDTVEVLQSDTALALKLVRMAEPLYPLPKQDIEFK